MSTPPIDIALEEQLAQRSMTGGIVLRLWEYMRPYKASIFLGIAFTLCATCSQLLGPRFIQMGIDRYLTKIDDTTAAIHGIIVISSIYLLNLLLGWLLSVAQVRRAIAAGQGAMNDVRVAVFEHIQQLSLGYFDKTHQGRIISRADTDIEALDQVMTFGLTQMLSCVLTLIGVISILLQYDWRLCLAVSAVLPPLFIATYFYQKRGMELFRRVREQSSRVTAVLAENITGIRVIQAMNREEVNLERFRDVNQTFTERQMESAALFHTYMPFLGLLSGAGVAVILGYGGVLVQRGELSVGELTAFILYLGMFFGPVQVMGELYNATLSTASSAERIFQLLDTKPEVGDAEGAVDLPTITGHVKFENVSFRYSSAPDAPWILKNVSFEAKSGETVALVGSTGSGKTTIISLLARFYEAQQGRIFVDGHELGKTTIESLRRQIGIVTQENFLFTGTVMENLKFGRPDCEDEDVYFAAKMLGTDEIISNLNNGYDTKVEERGANFSAGQRQLICFTRAMVAEPRILILDEATSAVDPQSEGTIQNALERLFACRTSFVIAHRLSTVRHAHLILVMSHGEIVERGTHDQLMALDGVYANLHREFAREH